MSVKIQLASDLHLELLEKNFPSARIIEPVEGADLLALAGDIHGATKAIKVFSDWPVPVLYVAGNHEFYSERWEKTRAALREACTGTQIRFLDNDAIELCGLRVLGCTLWTDFMLTGMTQKESMREVGRGLNDYLLITTEKGKLRPYQTLADHEHSRRWLEQELDKPFAGKTVVITHHGPHPLSIHPRYVGNRVNGGFVSDLTALVVKADLWLHGHIHDSMDYQVGGCRVVANPAGYLLNYHAAISGTEFEFENRLFDPRLLIEVTPRDANVIDLSRIPREAVTEAHVERQRNLMNKPLRSCTVVIEYVDSNLRLAEARDEATGERVSLTWNTVGVDFRDLPVGARLSVDVTVFNYAVAARTACQS